MDSTPYHSLIELFEQLGLPAEPEAIGEFIASHQLHRGIKIAEADFWNKSQADFINAALLEDAEWAIKVDSLAVSLGAGQR